MYKEFWNEYPHIAKLLPLFHVEPITRDRVVYTEIKKEIIKLQDDKHSLIIFPHGRHVDPKIIDNFFDYDLNTVPLGTFYIAARSSKPVLPIFMEPQNMFMRNLVLYGKPLYPEDFGLYKDDKRYDENKLLEFAKCWLEEIRRLYKVFPEYEGRLAHDYKLHKVYTDASGLNFRGLSDPNKIINYLDYIRIIENTIIKYGDIDLFDLKDICGIEKNIIKDILELNKIYDSHLKINCKKL